MRFICFFYIAQEIKGNSYLSNFMEKLIVNLRSRTDGDYPLRLITSRMN